jgi:cytochrome oxidase Cu insertion factor (SCO1/SenC/PrrC family)/thiol-disulfide isomerase/thioredoxin
MKRARSRRLLTAAVVVAVLLAAVGGVIADVTRRSSSTPATFTPNLDPGTSLTGSAPGFTLTDQFGAPVSLHSLRGKVVILAFNDSECTTICPLTTTAMVGARHLLGGAGSRVALIGIDANPHAISIKDVRAYSESHGMVHSWHFLTGSLPALRRVWRAYHIEVAVQRGQIDHTPALFVISPTGRMAKVYLTQMSYASIPQQAQLLAQEASSLLPGHPPVRSKLSYAEIPAIQPTASLSLTRVGGGAVRVGPSGTPRLYLFFASWDQQVTDLKRQLVALNHYQAAARTRRLPQLVAVDEASVEPSRAALTELLAGVGHRLVYPVAIDASGRVADGYGVQDEPWLALISGAGRPLWYYDVSVLGWPSGTALLRDVRAALIHSQSPSGAAGVQAALAGSPPALASLHRQAGQLLGGQNALFARIRALRGHPIVLNAWASWCAPCRSEFGLFGSSSALYGRRVAFIGVDTSDSSGDARAFLAQHQVSYPSYQSPDTAALGSLAVIDGLPSTIFIDRRGKVTYVHSGSYESQGSLDQDISTYAGGG